MSPAVRRKEIDQEGGKSARLKSRTARLAEFDENLFFTRLRNAYRSPFIAGQRQTAAFVKAFASALVEASTRGRANHGVGDGTTLVLDKQLFQRLQDAFKMHDKRYTDISLMLRNLHYDDYEFLSKAIIVSASNAGSEWATIRIMDDALQSAKIYPNVLKSRNVMNAHQHLREIARQGHNYRATVLAGKLAYELGDRDVAVALWRLAMDGAVAASEAARRARAQGVSAQRDGMAGADLVDLSSPWVELQSVYLGRKDYANAKWAIAIGCEQDDPNSHFAASYFEKDSVNYQSGWFYHITKAATSGNVRAMHELALWYAQNGWPYIEDEPPDEIKPTPFDRFPPEIRGKPDSEQSFWQRTRISLGLRPPAKENPVLQTFHSAAYPTTPQERFGMALEWLRIAMGFNYAPSFLAAAQLLLEKTLFSSAATPKEAVELSDERYSFASRADYELDKRIKRPPQEPEDDPPNPYYDPKEAKNLVREVFYAASALEFRLYEIREYIKSQVNTKADAVIEAAREDELPSDMGPNMKKWFRYPETRELYMNDRIGRLIDMDRPGVDLIEQAKSLCEDQKWDIYAEDGSLLYRHGVAKKR